MEKQKEHDNSKTGQVLAAAQKDFNELILNESKNLNNPKEILKKELEYVRADLSVFMQQSGRFNTGIEQKSLETSITNLTDAVSCYSVDNYDLYKGAILNCSKDKINKSTGLPLDIVTSTFNAEEQMLRDKQTNEVNDGVKDKYAIRMAMIKKGSRKYCELQENAVKKFIKEFPDHQVSRAYLAKHPDIQLQQNNPQKSPAGIETDKKSKGQER